MIFLQDRIFWSDNKFKLFKYGKNEKKFLIIYIFPKYFIWRSKNTENISKIFVRSLQKSVYEIIVRGGGPRKTVVKIFF